METRALRLALALVLLALALGAGAPASDALSPPGAANPPPTDPNLFCPSFTGTSCRACVFAQSTRGESRLCKCCPTRETAVTDTVGALGAGRPAAPPDPRPLLTLRPRSRAECSSDPNEIIFVEPRYDMTWSAGNKGQVQWYNATAGGALATARATVTLRRDEQRYGAGRVYGIMATGVSFAGGWVTEAGVPPEAISAKGYYAQAPPPPPGAPRGGPQESALNAAEGVAVAAVAGGCPANTVPSYCKLACSPRRVAIECGEPPQGLRQPQGFQLKAWTLALDPTQVRNTDAPAVQLNVSAVGLPNGRAAATLDYLRNFVLPLGNNVGMEFKHVETENGRVKMDVYLGTWRPPLFVAYEAATALDVPAPGVVTSTDGERSPASPAAPVDGTGAGTGTGDRTGAEEGGEGVQDGTGGVQGTTPATAAGSSSGDGGKIAGAPRPSPAPGAPADGGRAPGAVVGLAPRPAPESGHVEKARVVEDFLASLKERLRRARGGGEAEAAGAGVGASLGGADGLDAGAEAGAEAEAEAAFEDAPEDEEAPSPRARPAGL
eukprot:tig00000802_g4312.t1